MLNLLNLLFSDPVLYPYHLSIIILSPLSSTYAGSRDALYLKTAPPVLPFPSHKLSHDTLSRLSDLSQTSFETSAEILTKVRIPLYSLLISRSSSEDCLHGPQ